MPTNFNTRTNTYQPWVRYVCINDKILHAMKLGQHITFIQTSLHFYYRHEIEKVCGKYKRFYERRLLNLRCIKKVSLNVRLCRGRCI